MAVIPFHKTFFPDSTTTTLNPTADSYVNESGSTTNYGANTTMLSRYHGSGFARKSILKFDLSSIDNVDEAKLRLYGSSNGADIVCSVFGVDDDSWTEGTINWDNQPENDFVPSGVGVVTSSAGYVEFDVSEYVQANTGANISFLVWNSQDNQDTITFDAKEGTNLPELVVTYGKNLGEGKDKPCIPGLCQPWLEKY